MLSKRTPPEATWLQELKQMDGNAWQALVDHHTASLHRDIIASLCVRGLSPEAAEDIQQETWLTAVEKIGGFSCEGSDRLYRWLRVIALNHVRNYMRVQHQKSRWTLSLEELDDDNGYVPQRPLFPGSYPDQGAPEDVLIQRESLRQLNNTLHALNARDRELFLRRALLGEKPAALASIYTLDARVISKLLARSKKLLRERLGIKAVFLT